MLEPPILLRRYDGNVKNDLLKWRLIITIENILVWNMKDGNSRSCTTEDEEEITSMAVS